MERRGRNVAFDEQGRRVCSSTAERRECQRQPLKLHSRIGGACQHLSRCRHLEGKWERVHGQMQRSTGAAASEHEVPWETCARGLGSMPGHGRVQARSGMSEL